MYRDLGGGQKSYIRKRSENQAGITVACNQCISCRIERARQWSVRCVHESKMHEKNSYLTLTYNDESLPLDQGLHHEHWQLFAKQLRYHYGPFRYYMCGEYGEQFTRPHFHSIIFGHDFLEDRKYLKKNKYGDSLYKSEKLNEIWGRGFITIGECNQNSANYVAGYILKKITGKKANDHYETVCTTTGECTPVRHPYNNMSRSPGIGATWFAKFSADVFPRDIIVDQNGHKSQPPAFYDKLYEQLDPVQHKGVKERRLQNKNEFNNTLPRLAVRATVQDYHLNQKRLRDPNHIDAK